MKISLFEMPAEKCLAKVLIDYSNQQKCKATLTLADQEEVFIDHFSEKLHPIALTLQLLIKYRLLKNSQEISGIGHRIVAGGEVLLNLPKSPQL